MLEAPDWVQSVTPQQIVDQRAKGWTDFHPETFCHHCGHRNIKSWWVDGNIWEIGRIPGLLGTISCPSCFASNYEKVTGNSVVWELRIDIENLGEDNG